jgi:hypothetical protein
MSCIILQPHFFFFFGHFKYKKTKLIRKGCPQVQRSINQVLLKAYNLKCNKPGKSREEVIGILPRAEIPKKKNRKEKKRKREINSNFKAFPESSLRINQEYRTKK